MIGFVRGALGWLLACVTVVLLTGLPALAQQRADNMGPLDVQLGDDGRWQVESRNGWTLLRNGADPNSIRLYTVERGALASGQRTIAANVIVRGAPGAESFAGLLFNRASENEFMAALIRNDGAVVWMSQSPGREEIEPAEGVRARMDGTDILELRETPGRVEILLNGQPALTAEDANGFVPVYGIVAVGTGRFGFDAFAIADAPGGPVGDPRPPRGDAPPVTTDAAPTTPEQLRYAEVLLGTTLGILFHEFSHALIGETGLPATGPEEDVADGFSAFILSAAVEEGDLPPEEQQIFAEIVKYSALVWYYSAVANQAAGNEMPWQDEHAPDIKRFRNSFCIIYASNPQRYEDVATKVALDQRTRSRCIEEHRKRYAAWEKLLKTVSRNLGPDEQGDHPADAPGGRILLTFQPAQTPMGKDIQAMLDDTGVLRETFAHLEKLIVWPRDLQVEFRDCDDINAWYDPTTSKITMCYGVVEFFSKFVFDAEGGGATPVNVPNAPRPNVPNVPNPNVLDPNRYLVGTWSTTMAADGGQRIEMAAQFGQDGKYAMVIAAAGQRIAVEGTWRAAMGANNVIQVQLNPVRWEPAQICDAQGNCQPNNQAPQVVQVQYVDDNTLFSDGVNWTRTR